MAYAQQRQLPFFLDAFFFLFVLVLDSLAGLFAGVVLFCTGVPVVAGAAVALTTVGIALMLVTVCGYWPE